MLLMMTTAVMLAQGTFWKCAAGPSLVRPEPTAEFNSTHLRRHGLKCLQKNNPGPPA